MNTPVTDRHILVVEDEAKLARLLEDYLSNAGFRSTWLDNGSDAIPWVKEHAPDLILLDLMLPGMDGIDICRKVRGFSQVPIIMVTARVEEVDRLLGLELGADDYICKPFSPREVVARVRALLRRVQRLQQPLQPVAELRFGPFSLDTVRRSLTRDGQSLNLPLREFDLLAFLVRHPGRAFSRNELLQQVWGEGFDGYEHTVNSHINRLRARIEDDPRDPRRVVTVWGVGYRFDPQGV